MSGLIARGLVVTTYRATLGLVACEMGLDPLAVVSADPAANRPSDPAWLAAARARGRALYLTVTEIEAPMALVGPLAGVTKQAVSKALREIEMSRDDPKIDRLLDRVAAIMRGGV